MKLVQNRTSQNVEENILHKDERGVYDFGNIFRKLYSKSLKAVADKYGLKNNEISILSYLSSNKDKNTASNIVTDLMFTKSHVSMSIDSLVKLGYIEKQADEKDKKIMHLLLREKANDVIADLQVARGKLNEQMFKGFSNEEVDTLRTLLGKVILNITDILQ